MSVSATKRIKILNSIHQSILAATSSGAIAQTVLDQIPELLPYKQSAILLPDARSRALVVLAANLKSNSVLKPRTSFPLDGFKEAGVASSSFLTGKVEVVKDLRVTALPKRMQEALIGEGIRAVLDVPLVAAGKRIGALELYATMPRTPSALDLETARQVAGILAVALQQARLHEVVNTTRERLHALSHRQLEAEELQRRKLSRDLHDMVGQNLTAININLNTIAHKLPADTPDDVRRRLDDSSQLVEQVVERIRNLMADLRPSILDDLGLTPALRWYSGEFSKRTELPCRAAVAEIQPRLPPAAETALFRIAQEALTNVAKHANAKNVAVELVTGQESVVLRIVDDGAGFDFATMRLDPTKHGVGLVDMRERAEAIGGRIWVECQVGAGTVVAVEVPR